MPTILQPCLESQIIETATVKLKVAPRKSDDDAKKNSEFGGWSFHQLLTSTNYSTPNSDSKEKDGSDHVYVHPMAKRCSPLKLSGKSLELCTENLGCETGTDIVDINILSLSSSSSSSSYYCNTRKITSQQQEQQKEKAISRNFPPPLTTISGATAIHVKPHREGGRLVIEAMEAPLKRTYLQAERSNGRLTLTLLKHHPNIHIDSSQVTEDENPVFDNEATNDDEVDAELDLAGDENDKQDDGDVDGEEEEEGEERGKIGKMLLGNDMDGNTFDIEVEMGMEKFQRLRRCNEGGLSNKRLCNWEPLWVATS